MKFISYAKWVACFVVLLASFSTSYGQYNLVVAQDGSGNYTTVQAAINAAPSGQTSAYVIYIKNGTYNEVVSIPSTKPFIQLVGQSVENTIITYNNGATTIVNGSALGTNNSATLTVSASDCALLNLTIQNTFGDPGVQAVAILLNNDRIAVKNCRLMGNQDTLYTKGTGTPRHYFRNCYIDGTVDFMFGSSVDIFDSCVIYCKTRAVTGTPPSCTAVNTTAGQAYGYVYRNCILPANTLATSYYLGRQWQNSTGFTPTSSPAQANNKVAFLNCTLGAHILPVGWSLWDSGTDTTKVSDAEYSSINFDGTATNVSSRVTWSQQLTYAQDTTYTTANIFNVSGTSWNPCPIVGCGVYTPDIAISNFKVTKGTSSSTLNWNISWPISGVTYGLYRSTDSLNYSMVNSVTAANDTNVNFQLTDTLPTQGNIFYYYVKGTLSGYAADSTSVLSISSKPTIVATSSMGTFTQYNGTPSGSSSYTDSGVNLTANIVVTAPANFQVSTDNTNFASSVSLTQSSGVVHPTTVYVRLNSSTLGNYSGNITQATTGGTTVNVAVSGKDTTQPLYTESVLEEWPLTTNNSDSAAVRATGIVGTVPTLSNLHLSTWTGTTAAYTGALGELLYSGDSLGYWSTAHHPSGNTATVGNAGNLSRIYYQQFTVTAATGYTMRVDSLIMNAAFYNSSSATTMDVMYSTSNFVSDSTNIYSYSFTTSGDIALANLTTTNTGTKRLALVGGGSGVTIGVGGTLTFRIYFTCSSSSSPRFSELLDLIVKGVAPSIVTTDYYCAATGNLDAAATWGTNTDGSGTHPSDFVTQGQVFHVANGNPCNISGSTWTVSGTSSRVKLDQGTDMTISSGHTLVGKIAVGAGRTLTINNSTAPTLDTLGATATIVYGMPSTIPSSQTSFPNLQVSAATSISANTSVSGTLTMSGAKLNLNGNTLTINDIAGGSAANSITGSSTSGLIVNGSLSSPLYFDQTSTSTASLGTLTLNGNATLGNALTVGSTLYMNTGKLNLNGNILTLNNISGASASNCFTGSPSSGLILSGNLTGSLYFDQTSVATATLDTFAVNGNATLGNNMNIGSGIAPGTMTVGSGATLTTGGNLTLKSDGNGTARIGTVSGTINGNVNIERLVQAQRGYRILTHPFTGNQNISSLGSYMDITGLTAGNIGACTSTTPSLYSYIPNTGWTGITATGSGTFPAASTANDHGNGILAFVRGAQGQGCGAGVYTPTAPLIMTTGAVNVGSASLQETVPTANGSSAVAHGWNLISNPLPSQIALSGVGNIGSIDDNIYVINPAGQNSGHAYSNGTQYTILSISGDHPIIPMNSGFLAHNSTGADITLSFPESAKTAISPITGTVFKTTGAYPTLELSVMNGTAMWDNWQLNMKPYASEHAGDNGDVTKISNTNLSFYSYSSDGYFLARDARDADSIADGDIITFGLNSVPQLTYNVVVTQYTIPANKDVYLHDKYTNSYVKLGNGTIYPLTINADVASQGKGRLELLFNNANNTGVSGITAHNGMTIIPNPATSNITLSYDDNYRGAKAIEIVNTLGQVVKRINTDQNAIVVAIDAMPNGVYMVKTMIGTKTITQRFIKE